MKPELYTKVVELEREFQYEAKLKRDLEELSNNMFLQAEAHAFVESTVKEEDIIEAISEVVETFLKNHPDWIDDFCGNIITWAQKETKTRARCIREIKKEVKKL